MILYPNLVITITIFYLQCYVSNKNNPAYKIKNNMIKMERNNVSYKQTRRLLDNGVIRHGFYNNHDT